MAYPFYFQRVRALLGRDPTLAVLLPEAERLRVLNGRLAQALPPALARACQVAAVRNGEAVVVCGNGAAAARVRSQATSLARTLTAPAWPVERIKVRVQADWARPERRAKPGLGAAALQAWDELEHALPDGALKAAVDRLLARHRRP